MTTLLKLDTHRDELLVMLSLSSVELEHIIMLQTSSACRVPIDSYSLSLLGGRTVFLTLFLNSKLGFYASLTVSIYCHYKDGQLQEA